MNDTIYAVLNAVGYTHPLHPALTHLPVGLVMGGFLFYLAGLLLNKALWARTAQHSFVLALIMLLPTVVTGLMDWQRYYSGAWLFPVSMKMILATALLIALIVAVYNGRKGNGSKMMRFISSALCVCLVIGLGYFGGELVYGTSSEAGESDDALVQSGAKMFEQSCSLCHHSDQKATKIGPGLKDLFKNSTEDNIRKQLKTPLDKMPAFNSLSEEKIQELLAYLKTL